MRNFKITTQGSAITHTDFQEKGKHTVRVTVRVNSEISNL